MAGSDADLATERPSDAGPAQGSSTAGLRPAVASAARDATPESTVRPPDRARPGRARATAIRPAGGRVSQPRSVTLGPGGIRDTAPPYDLEAAIVDARGRLVAMAPRDVDLFVIRLARHWPDLVSGLTRPYGAGRTGLDPVLRDLVGRMTDAYLARSEPLRLLDLERAVSPDWFQEPATVGYVCYVEQFAGTLPGVLDHLDHLEHLGIRYVHLMALLEPRPGDNDGGYAVADYRAIDPRLGTMADLERVAAAFHERGISICVDFVLNHTAAEHEWARRAATGDPEASARYWIFPDRRMPDRYEASLPEVFPDFAPGSFSRLADGRWVWTTFNTFQWDLNWSNPVVFAEMLETLLWLANRGVDVLRLDAIAFIWKRLGTDSQNQPEVHDLVMALRACARVVAPGIVFKAEAIVGPAQLAPYLGVGRHYGRECDLAYQNSLMVQFWSSLATRDTILMTAALAAFPGKPPSAAWATYIRCHDDIGWAIADEDATARGWDGWSHRAFLSDFYSGEFPGSFARGERFQVNPQTGDSRISGTFASLAGLEAAVNGGSDAETTLAIDRILLGHALILGWDGLPLLYMGDEIGLFNDRTYLADPARASDNRWLHRPPMDWPAAARAESDPGSVAGRLLNGVRALLAARRDSVELHAATPLDVIDPPADGLFAFVRRHPTGSLLAVHNLTDRFVEVPPGLDGVAGSALVRDRLGPRSGRGRRGAARPATRLDEPVRLAPYAVRWWVPAQEPGR